MNCLKTVNLLTNRCILRRFELSDSLSVYNSYMDDKDIHKYLLDENHKSVFETELMIRNFVNNYNNLNYYNWIIINKDNYDVIGTICIHSIDIYNDKGEIGIIISKKYQKKGYSKEVVSNIIYYAFNVLKLHRLEARIMLDNFKSKNLFASLGFKNEGILYSRYKKNNKFYDVYLFSLLNI